MEIYNEIIYDLLSGRHAEPLKVRITEDGHAFVEDLAERPVHSVAQVTQS
jgi:hypothetical protein